MSSDRIIIDGSAGEGGGQVLRTCLSLAALTGRPFELHNVRAGRAKPGLRPQHLTAVRACAAICAAELRGAELNSQFLSFTPQTPPQPGAYTFDVSEAAGQGSAGAVTLILQALLWPLLFAAGPSSVRLRGGTHVPHSPPYHYLAHVARPAFARFDADFSTELRAWGWYPQGQGELTATIRPLKRLHGVSFVPAGTKEVFGVAAVTNLPAHIPQRMSRRAANLLGTAGLTARVEPVRAHGPGPGAGIFLWLANAGFSALGRPGLPAEEVAGQAVAECLAFVENGVAVDLHLADQLLLPAALAHGRTTYTTNTLTLHTLTSADLLQQWLGTEIEINGRPGEAAHICIDGIGYQPEPDQNGR